MCGVFADLWHPGGNALSGLGLGFGSGPRAVPWAGVVGRRWRGGMGCARGVAAAWGWGGAWPALEDSLRPRHGGCWGYGAAAQRLC